ncbi:hypothetical protein HanXRQr2_Chr04g0145241 [Helianthus annuus]|uniref:Putative DNA glycosylase n=1 Tax=Helianthus annuus TaxID=4232 RepID=A0A251SD41_HELAN|nr:hypothetical protein HanXRQr2_Chr04g0145241 [Helianthus annuus]KAJ0579603.1 hypothetical protein HanHA300_Chr04g0119761 [Helianthus annuus]KAJ0595499.1 hypothetical protein HanHA89_Chr04g0132021 [Helianthus annuus]KAJ0929671.1 hypothetical protein HanPSC8_Chr04g0140341 [Helianthus annuus]
MILDAKTDREVLAEAIENLITPLGLQKGKTERIQRFSEGYLWDGHTSLNSMALGSTSQMPMKYLLQGSGGA